MDSEKDEVNYMEKGIDYKNGWSYDFEYDSVRFPGSYCHIHCHPTQSGLFYIACMPKLLEIPI